MYNIPIHTTPVYTETLQEVVLDLICCQIFIIWLGIEQMIVVLELLLDLLQQVHLCTLWVHFTCTVYM